jgi:heptose I phosphotransferase
VSEIETWDGGRVAVSRGFADVLRAAGLVTFESFFGERVGKLLRDVGPRANVRLTLDTPAGPRTFFLKRHVPLSAREKLCAALRLARPRTPGRVEWENIAALERLGIPTMTRVAFGEERCCGRSFVMTEEIADATPADDFARANWIGYSPAAVAARRDFARRLGDLVRTLHSAGLTHRDLYLCHVFVRRTGGSGFALHLIDLQRVGPRRLARWRVKDVAQFQYSRPDGVFTRTDAMRFLHHYFALSRLGASERNFVRSVLRKVESMRRHNEKPEE